MPKLETPEEFAAKLSDRQHTAPYIASLIAARDAAIRAESAALLKTCGEALEATLILRDEVEARVRTIAGLQQEVQPFIDAQYIKTCQGFSSVDKIKLALAALREAGVIE